MRILVNASNIHVGGGTQVALSFINLLKNFPQHQFCIFASSKVHEQINFEIYVSFCTNRTQQSNTLLLEQNYFILVSKTQHVQV